MVFVITYKKKIRDVSLSGYQFHRLTACQNGDLKMRRQVIHLNPIPEMAVLA